MLNDQSRSRNLVLGGALCLFVVICCLSLLFVTQNDLLGDAETASLRVFYDSVQFSGSILAVAAFSIILPLFLFANFSFGYFVGFYFYTIVIGYLWLNCLTNLNYDHRMAAASATISAIVFLVPVLFVTRPVRQIYCLSLKAFDRMLICLLLLGVAVIACGATYNFKFVAIQDIYQFRGKVELPSTLNYLIGMTSTTLLPFAFAGFIARKVYWGAGAIICVLVFFYPITFSKMALFTPAWLIAFWAMSRYFEPRMTVVVSLLIPLMAGIAVTAVSAGRIPVLYFSIVNFRMVAIPSIAIDVYNEFFARHDLTHFCQISVLKRFMRCPYQEQLGSLLERAYKLGNFNASLFATEGIASVGTFMAPIPALLCGLFIALINRLTAGLSASFVLISAAILPQVLLNVPLTTAIVTYGAGPLFLLWYVTPRMIFAPEPRS